MRILIFFTIFITVFSLITLFISKRFVNRLDLSYKIKKYINIFLLFNLLGIVFYILARNYPYIPNTIYFLLSIPIGILFLLFVTTIFYEIFILLLKFSPINNQRRKFFKKSLDMTALAAATTVNAKAIYNARTIELEKISIKIKNLKKQYTIVQLSDIHIGGLIDKKFIKSLVDQINILNCDLVVITGDLVDTNLEFAKDAINELAKLKSKYGTYFIVGNHEYFHDLENIISHIKSLNIKVLENENIYIGEKNKGFYLAGVYDIMGYRINRFKPDVNKAIKNCNDAPIILLAHQPKFIEEVPKSVSLVLSGHTHGGQIIPFNLLVRLQQHYVKGLNSHNENTQIYINKGTGFWGPPMRLGASSEITHITIS